MGAFEREHGGALARVRARATGTMGRMLDVLVLEGVNPSTNSVPLIFALVDGDGEGGAC